MTTTRRAPRSRSSETMRIELLDEVNSTNEYIKRYLPHGEDVIVCARRQTQGQGTKNRSFLSLDGGVYLTALNFYADLPVADAFKIMAHAAVAVCRTAEGFGVGPEIKWANDVLAGGKKLCGILIQNGLRDGRVVYSIVGIGVNACNDVSAVGGIATTLTEQVGKHISAEEARERLIEEYRRPSSFEEYLSYVKFLGKTVRVIEGEAVYEAVASRILADGRLEIDIKGQKRVLSSAEIGIIL